MALDGVVINVAEQADSRDSSWTLGDGCSYTRKFLVRTSKPATPLLAIFKAPGVKAYAAHPEDLFSRATNFEVKPSGKAVLLWTVTIKYTPMKFERQEMEFDQQPTPSLPATVWTGGASMTEAVMSKDVTGKVVANSAGVPFKDATRRVPSPALSATGSFATLAAAQTAIMAITGKTNSVTWAGGTAGEWLCEAAKWSWKSESVGNFEFRYVEVNFEFSFMDGTHDLLLLDIGFMEKDPVSGKLKPINGEDQKPVKEPVALDGAGKAAAPGVPAVVVNAGKGFQAYARTDFKAVVGDPT